MLFKNTDELFIEYESPTNRLSDADARPKSFELPGLGASVVIIISPDGNKQRLVLSQYFNLKDDQIISRLCRRSIDLLTPEDEDYALSRIQPPTMLEKTKKRVINFFLHKPSSPFQALVSNDQKELNLDGLLEYDIKKESGLSIKRYHFTKWLDYGVISPNIFKQLIESIYKVNNNSLDGILIRCWGGRGRTGTFASGIIFYDWFVNNASATEKSDYDFLIKKMLEIVLFLRQINGSHTLETSSQLQLLLDLITTLSGKPVVAEIKEIQDPILGEREPLAYRRNIQILKNYVDYVKKQIQRDPVNKAEILYSARQQISFFKDCIILFPPKIGPPPLPRGDQ